MPGDVLKGRGNLSPFLGDKEKALVNGLNRINAPHRMEGYWEHGWRPVKRCRFVWTSQAGDKAPLWVTT